MADMEDYYLANPTERPQSWEYTCLKCFGRWEADEGDAAECETCGDLYVTDAINAVDDPPRCVDCLTEYTFADFKAGTWATDSLEFLCPACMNAASG